MNKLSFTRLIAIVYTSAFLISCSPSAQLTDNSTDKKKLSKWYKSKDWLNGLQLTPHQSINQQEFSRQYQTKNVWWDKAFEFLKTHDLPNLKPGSYLIDTGNVIATVSELSPKKKNQVSWEAHRNFNDIQYIIRGKAQMGVNPISDTKVSVTTPYTSKGDIELYSVDGGRYYDAEPGTFFIFSPKEVHRAAFKKDGYETIKKVVIKVRAS